MSELTIGTSECSAFGGWQLKTGLTAAQAEAPHGMERISDYAARDINGNVWVYVEAVQWWVGSGYENNA